MTAWRKPIFDAAKSRGAVFNSAADVADMDLAIEEALRLALFSPPVPSADARRRISPDWVLVMHDFEGCKLTTYKDPGSKDGLPITGGRGTTRDENGKPFKLGFTAPQEYWDRLFARDIAAYENGVSRLTGTAPTSQHQFDALVSLAYNIGIDEDEDTIAEGLGDSTLLKQHLAGNVTAAAASFINWRFNDRREMPGLVTRRKREAQRYRGEG